MDKTHASTSGHSLVHLMNPQVRAPTNVLVFMQAYSHWYVFQVLWEMITSAILAPATTIVVHQVSNQMIHSGMDKDVAPVIPAALLQMTAVIAHHGLSNICHLSPQMMLR